MLMTNAVVLSLSTSAEQMADKLKAKTKKAEKCIGNINVRFPLDRLRMVNTCTNSLHSTGVRVMLMIDV